MIMSLKGPSTTGRDLTPTLPPALAPDHCLGLDAMYLQEGGEGTEFFSLPQSGWLTPLASHHQSAEWHLPSRARACVCVCVVVLCVVCLCLCLLFPLFWLTMPEAHRTSSCFKPPSNTSCFSSKRALSTVIIFFPCGRVRAFFWRGGGQECVQNIGISPVFFCLHIILMSCSIHIGKQTPLYFLLEGIF